jgi:hypothetical protein
MKGALSQSNMKNFFWVLFLLNCGRTTVQALKGHATLQALDPSRGFVQKIRTPM